MCDIVGHIYSTAPCDEAGCDQVCVGGDMNTQAECLCADGYQLMPDGVCSGED